MTTSTDPTVLTVAGIVGEADPTRRWSDCIKLAQEIVSVVDATRRDQQSHPSEEVAA